MNEILKLFFSICEIMRNLLTSGDKKFSNASPIYTQTRQPHDTAYSSDGKYRRK